MIETEAAFLQARKMGFHLFHGYFFSKPSIVSKSSSKITSQAQYLRILSV